MPPSTDMDKSNAFPHQSGAKKTYLDESLRNEVDLAYPPVHTRHAHMTRSSHPVDAFLFKDTKKAYEMKSTRWRKRNDWLASQRKEDCFLLFGQTLLNTDTGVASWQSDGPPRTSSVTNCLERFKWIQQTRYFWDFLYDYDKQNQEAAMKLSRSQNQTWDDSSRDAAIQRAETYQRLAQKRRSKEKTTGTIRQNSTPSNAQDTATSFLDSLNPAKKSPCHSLMRQNKNTQTLAFEICQATAISQLYTCLKAWCEDLDEQQEDHNDKAQEKLKYPLATKRLMEFFDSQHPPTDPTPDSFEEKYKTPSKEQIDTLRQIVEERNSSKKRQKDKKYNIKKEATIIGGGRYAIR